MNILILGSGARESAFIWKLSQSKKEVNIFSINPNAGIQELSTPIYTEKEDLKFIKYKVIELKIDMVLVGPEIPLIDGIQDYLKKDPLTKKTAVIGPSKKGAQLEGSKDFAKNFMHKYNIPTAKYRSFSQDEIKEGLDYLETIEPPYVLKADGPAAGKGVLIIDNVEDAKIQLEEMLLGKFGESSKTVVIEEFLDGIEMSCFVLFDGKNYKVLPYAKDYKRIGENDTGLNTGGMGSVSPVPFLDKKLKQKIEDKIIKPTIEGIKNEDIDYKGFIFIGLINVRNEPYVIEYNVRMGDPETQVVLSRVKNDFVDLLISCDHQKLDKLEFEVDSNYFVNIVLASGGYPEKYEKGKMISGIESVDESIIFHAGTLNRNDEIYTNGGRVLSVVSTAPNLNEALKKSYKTISKIHFQGKTFRKDIGFDL
ncbi:MAG: phosphoribosylamine--glycine ligase [Cryomorphaceae bacterium]|mgnify:CR=1 FL=1|nr:MAG: phosphoribosylamine--glycine ligase [Cryomorphaceae bacterium]